MVHSLGMIRFLVLLLLVFALFSGCGSGSLLASTLSVPQQPAEEVLSESVPTAFAPADFGAEDYEVRWIGKPIYGVSAQLESRSLEWVRISEVLVIPRARLNLTADSIEKGTVSSAKFVQAFSIAETKRGAGGTRAVVGRAQIPVALISGEQNPIQVTVVRNGAVSQGALQIRFKPRTISKTPRVFLDPSCSRFDVSTLHSAFRQDEWAYIGCRLVQAHGAAYRTSSLEVFIFWDNVGQKIRVSGIETSPAVPSIWALRLRSEPGSVHLRAMPPELPPHEIQLAYRIPKDLYYGSIGLGLGPYACTLRDGSNEVSNWTLMPTIYVSYFISDSMRLTAFDATTLNRQFISDLGLYLNSESIRTMDRRVAINLMLGVHSIGFRANGQYYYTVGVPQGLEMMVTDFLMPARNLHLGAFIYPSIQGKAYYNTWLRWGSSRLFGEVNYISWEENISETHFSSRSLGISVGFPVPFFRFW